MAKVTDFNVSPEVNEIMTKMADTFPKIFPGFDAAKIGCTHTTGKVNSRKPIALKAVKYPYDVYCDKVYIAEVAQDTWQEMSEKQKRLAVFHTMCAIPEGAFDPQSKKYAGKRRPDYEMYAEEFAASGGVPNWMDNEDAEDPLDAKTPKKVTGRKPITSESIESVGDDE
jgi:hypothetical protein